MEWKDLLNCPDSLMQIKTMAIEKMKTIYPFSMNKRDHEVCFSLPDGLYMQFWTSRGKTSFDDAIGMEYGDRPDLLPDDGDLYYPVDYDSFEDFFNALLEETQRVEDDF